MGKGRKRALRAHDREFKRADEGKKKADEAGQKWTMGSQYGVHRDVDQKKNHKSMQEELKTLKALSDLGGMNVKQAQNLKSDGANDEFMALMPDHVKDKNTDIQSQVVPAMSAGFGAEREGATKNEVHKATLGDRTFFDKEAKSEGMAGDEAGRELYLPLMSHALGLDTLALAGRGQNEEGKTRIVTEGAAGKSIGQRLTDATDEDMDALSKVSGDDVMKTMMSQLLFQDKDGHSEQYLVDDDGGLVKIDQGDMGLDENGGDFSGANDQNISASSFMAAMPAAFDEISEEMYKMVENWDPEQFREMQEKAGIWEQDGSIDRQTGNMQLLKDIMKENRGRLTPNELFKKFNTAKFNKAMEEMATNNGEEFEAVEEHPMFTDYKDTELKGTEEGGQKAYDSESGTYENMGRFGTEQVWEGDAWHDSMKPRSEGYAKLDEINEQRKANTDSNRELDDQMAHELKKWQKKAKGKFVSKRRKRKLADKYGGRIDNLAAQKT